MITITAKDIARLLDTTPGAIRVKLARRKIRLRQIEVGEVLAFIASELTKKREWVDKG